MLHKNCYFQNKFTELLICVNIGIMDRYGRFALVAPLVEVCGTKCSKKGIVHFL